MRRKTSRHILLFRVVVSIGLVALLAGSAAAGQIGFVYALQQVNGGANQIYGFRFDSSSGGLTLLPGFPVASGGTGTANLTSEQLVYADGRLYVLNNGSDTMTAFDVNRSTGALTATRFGAIALGTGTWVCLAVHPSGSPVVVGNGLGGLSSFVVTDTTATAAAGSPFATGTALPFSCGFSHDGKFVYTGGNSGTVFAGFSVNSGTGVLTPLPGSPFESGGDNPLGYATDSSGRLFSVMAGAAQVRAFTTASGVPTGVSGNPFASGLTEGIHGVLHPGGFYLVADRLGNRVGSYQIAGTGASTTLTAVSGSPFAAGGTLTNALAVTPDGAFLLAANGLSRNLTVFHVDASSGALKSIGVQDANTLGASGNISGLAFATGEAGFFYTLQQVNGGSNQIHGFRIDPSTGALIMIAGFPVASGGTGGGAGGYSEMIAYRNGRLYVINDGGDTVTALKVNRTTGALTALPFSPITLGAGDWSCIAVHPSGSPVVVGNSAGGLSSFDINATTAAAAAGSPFTTGAARPFSCSFSQGGNYVYTGGNSGSTFAGFSVDSATGVLTPLAGSPFDSGGGAPLGYATDSFGRLYSVNAGAGHVRAFTTSAGVPTGVSGNPFTSGLTLGVHGVRHPSDFYMAADRLANQVGVYRISGSGAATTLNAVSGSPFATGGSLTHALALTDDGAFLGAVNGTSRNLTVFQVNPATGGLTFLGVQPVNTLGATGNVPGVVFAAVVPPFIDDPLTAFSSVIKAIHISELRTRIDAARAQYGLAPYAYEDPTLKAALTMVRAVHITDLRAALADVYSAAGIAAPSYTDPILTIGTSVAKVAHIAELRAAVLAIE
jgi:6-phosphogluconolactonase (cycloisomerase 2 family)